MAEKLTMQQQQAVEDRGGHLLVSAAAGSGKTKVLVDRLMRYILDPIDPANIDDFLIITYTKAAAAELRGKIAAKLSEHIAQHPENRHLQQQMQRLYLAKISTVHAFCTDILREYAYRLDLSSDFRVLDENEALELQARAMHHVLNDAYDNVGNDSNFVALVDTQGLGRDDRNIPEIVYQVYNSAKCHLNPKEWLDWCMTSVNVSGLKDAAETVWGRYLMSDLHRCLDLHIEVLEKCVQQAATAEEMEKPAGLLNDTISQLYALRNARTWDEIYKNRNIDYGRLTFSKKCTDLTLAERIRQIREACKKDLTKKLRNFCDDSEQILWDMQQLVSATAGLICLTRKFGDAYDRLKQNRRVLDFGDLEHKTLDLLLGKNRSCATRDALEIGARFREVMVDEYQDSNIVQDSIFSALTNEKHNCFMVGDVKQSIYQFRLADPGIFLEKYNTFVPAKDAIHGQGRKVLLSSNFRSAGNVISAVNDVFTACMSPTVGGLEYTADEALNEGIPHETIEENEIELHGIVVQEDTYSEEANFVAKRISQLLDGTHMIRGESGLRPILPGDIAILLRSPGSIGGDYRAALERAGIRCTIGTSTDLLQTEEIETLRAILQVINNPLQDIPLLCVLTSRVFCFTADDLASIRGKNRDGCIYNALKKSEHNKAKEFIAVLDVLRTEARLHTLSQLLTKILISTKMDSIFSALPGGAEKVENLQNFCNLAASFGADCTLGSFLERLKAMDDRGVVAPDRGADQNAVTIMSIHKSKGLEFPVVFLCALSRDFNTESARVKVLCDKELGLGLSCVDASNRVRYPSLAKRAIAAKIIAQGISEEMRVLYVAMTRAKDRLIMTYATKNLEKELTSLVQRMDMSSPLLITANADCPGKWILYAALKRKEANAFFQIAGYPESTDFHEIKWEIRVVSDISEVISGSAQEEILPVEYENNSVDYVSKHLSFRYPYILATTAPSKQTATQLKGRMKDIESAENTNKAFRSFKKWREPSFVSSETLGKDYGTAMHAALQYINYQNCKSPETVKNEITRLVDEEFISKQQAQLVDCQQISDFFATDIGRKLQENENVLREFKFSILDEGEKYCPGMTGERVLLQGVVDCALIEDDGITILDFKTDRVTSETLQSVAEGYRTQIGIYSQALSRIYKLPVKKALLYFTRLGEFWES